MLNKSILVIIFLTAFHRQTLAQDDNLSGSKDFYCSPGVIGLPRSKGVVFKYEIIPPYTVKSTSKNLLYNNADAGISRNGRLDIKIRVPIINKPGIIIIGGLHYYQEQLHFTNPSEINYPIYVGLEDRSLKSVGGQFYVVKPTKKNTYFLLRTSLDFNGDFTQSDIAKKDMLKISVAPMFGWKRNDNLSYAVGVAFGYVFGRGIVYPVFSYNKNFSSKWGIESLLPAFIKLRYSNNEKQYWYFATVLSGASYRLSNKIPGLESTVQPHIHHSEIKLGLTLEQEMHNWLWCSAEIGYRRNFQFNLTNSAGRNKDVLIKNKLSGAVYIGLSLFMVPPKKWLKVNNDK